VQECPAEQRERWRSDLTLVLDSLDRVEGKGKTASCSTAPDDVEVTNVPSTSVFQVSTCSPAGSSLVADKPAAMIRQAARSKALRLLGELST
jgi:hypothetical protein